MTGLKLKIANKSVSLQVGQHVDVPIELASDATGRGIRVELSGEAVDRGLVRPFGGWATGTAVSDPSPEARLVWARDGAVWVAEKPDFGFLPATSDPPGDTAAFLRTMMLLSVELQADAAGAGELIVSVQPNDPALEPARGHWHIDIHPVSRPVEHLHRLGCALSREPFARARLACALGLAELAFDRWIERVELEPRTTPRDLLRTDLDAVWQALQAATGDAIPYAVPSVWEAPPMAPDEHDIVDDCVATTGPGPTLRETMGERLAWLVACVVQATGPGGDGNFDPIDSAPWSVVQSVARFDLELAALAATDADGFDYFEWSFEEALERLGAEPSLEAAVRRQQAVLQLVQGPARETDLSRPSWVDRFRPA